MKAVVLFNLGGPGSLDQVEPFLFNLFNDPAIIRLPNPFRGWLAKLISKRRTPEAQHIYAQIGGHSPILKNTKAQADALQSLLEKSAGHAFPVFIAMRYTHPRAREVINQLKDLESLSEVILLPLYPQFSTTTSGSSLDEFTSLMRVHLPAIKVEQRVCYPVQQGVVNSFKDLIIKEISPLKDPFRILFSAHGLPQSIVKAGDPYAYQVEQTVEAVVAALSIPHLDYRVCYQSRVGPLKWIGPATKDELRRAALENKNVVLVPISFVSEHSETLVELDIEYAQIANDLGIQIYRRVPALGIHPDFIQGLKSLVEGSFQPFSCPEIYKECRCRNAF